MSPRAAARLRQLGFDDVYDYGPGKSDWLAAGLPREGTSLDEELAGDVAARDVPTCRVDERAAGVAARIGDSPYRLAVVVAEEGVVVGLLREGALDDAGSVAEAMEPGPSTVRALEPVDELRERMARNELASVLVTTPEGALIGLVQASPASQGLRRDQPRAAGVPSTSGGNTPERTRPSKGDRR